MIHGTGCFRIPDLGADSCPGNGTNFVPNIVPFLEQKFGCLFLLTD